jgi:hypothetical protein
MSSGRAKLRVAHWQFFAKTITQIAIGRNHLAGIDVSMTVLQACNEKSIRFRHLRSSRRRIGIGVIDRQKDRALATAET